MKKSALRYLLCGVLALLIWTNAFAQLRLGPRRLVDAPAPTLDNPEHLGNGLTKPRYVGAVGGVAFDKVASPVENLTFVRLSLNYYPDRIDGNRLGVTVDGKVFSSLIYDWQLIPIAKFADSPYYSCITLFGKLSDPEKEAMVKKNGGRVINYHFAFSNTLLGLRLFGLDILITEPEAIYLPKNQTRYLLGKGEPKPNIRINRIGWNNYLRHIEPIEANLESKYRSYVICDYGRDIRFNFQGDSLLISGEPYYYFWKYKSDDPGYQRSIVSNTILNEIETRIRADRFITPTTFDEKEWYITALAEQISQYVQEHKALDSVLIKELTNLQEDASRKALLRKYSVSSLRKILVSLRVYMDSYTVIPLKEYSERISDQPQLLRGINPAVWDAGVNVMRYAAFFRYCKQNYPEQWRSFIGQINRAPMLKPQIKTPSILER